MAIESTSAYNAAEAAEDVGDTAGAAGYMDVAQKAANRAVSFSEHNRPLLPQNLQSKGTPIENFKAPDKGNSGGSSGDSNNPTSGSNIK